MATLITGGNYLRLMAFEGLINLIYLVKNTSIIVYGLFNSIKD